MFTSSDGQTIMEPVEMDLETAFYLVFRVELRGFETPGLLHAMPADSVWPRRAASDSGWSIRQNCLAVSGSAWCRLSRLSLG
jgi:hypothetical protein